MTAVLIPPPVVVPDPPAAPRLGPALVVTVLHAALFVVLRPGVPDLEAALARATAAAHGVGLTYWFQWFGGGSPPGQYSVLSPWLSSWLGAPLLGALATVAVTPLVARLMVRTAHPTIGLWVALLTAGLNLWSGRIAFALGAAFALLALVGVRERRWVLGAVGVVGAVVSSPVAAAFLAVGLATIGLTERGRRQLAWTLAGLGGAALLAVAYIFGSPGPQIFELRSAVAAVLCTVVMLAARPHRTVRIVIALTALAAPVLLLVPNGLGSNLGRLTYICLPVAVVATSAVRRRWAVLFIAPAVAVCGWFTVHDLRVATGAAAATSYYDGLRAELSGVPDLHEYRLEVVQSRSFHTAAYALLDRAALATGWETQTQRTLDPILTSSRLSAASYRTWLDDNAVGYLALDRRSPDAVDREYRVVAGGLAYLTPVWRDATWTLFRVRRATPIVAPPARLMAADQSALTLLVTRAGPVHVRVHWSRFLEVVTPGGALAGTVTAAPDGWSVVTVPAAGTYRLAGD